MEFLPYAAVFICGVILIWFYYMQKRQKNHPVLKKRKKFIPQGTFWNTYMIIGFGLILLLVVILMKIRDGNNPLENLSGMEVGIGLILIVLVFQRLLEHAAVRDQELEKEEEERIYSKRKQKWDEHTQMQLRGKKHDTDDN